MVGGCRAAALDVHLILNKEVVGMPADGSPRPNLESNQVFKRN
jgi:hypothetical protein